jgi:hypothetical protein
MAESRKGDPLSCRGSSSLQLGLVTSQAYTLQPGSDDESTIKVAPRKEGKVANGTIKLKRPAPKHKSPGNWKEGSVVDG